MQLAAEQGRRRLRLPGRFRTCGGLSRLRCRWGRPGFRRDTLVDWLHVASSRVPEDVAVTGVLAGSMAYRPGAGWDGEMVLSDAGLTHGRAEALVVGDVAVQLGGAAWQLYAVHRRAGRLRRQRVDLCWLPRFLRWVGRSRRCWTGGSTVGLLAAPDGNGYDGAAAGAGSCCSANWGWVGGGSACESGCGAFPRGYGGETGVGRGSGLGGCFGRDGASAAVKVRQSTRLLKIPQSPAENPTPENHPPTNHTYHAFHHQLTIKNHQVPPIFRKTTPKKPPKKKRTILWL